MPRKPARKTKTTIIKKNGEWDTSWHEDFLTALRETCNVSEATRLLAVNRSMAYRHRQQFPEFAAAWDDAEQQAIESLEYEAWRRARTQSDTLMIFLLKAHKPEKYREKFEHQHKGNLALSFAELATLAADEQQEAGNSDFRKKPE